MKIVFYVLRARLPVWPLSHPITVQMTSGHNFADVFPEKSRTICELKQERVIRFVRNIFCLSLKRSSYQQASAFL